MKQIEPLLIIYDADALIALVNISDANHVQAVTISCKLMEQNATVLTPVTAVLEAITALRRTINRPDLAKVIIEACTSGDIQTIDVPADILPEALAIFKPAGSKKDTMFDAVVAALAIRNKADAIFSFDNGYKKTKIPLIADLLLP